jgi:hypothetical protein
LLRRGSQASARRVCDALAKSMSKTSSRERNRRSPPESWGEHGRDEAPALEETTETLVSKGFG